MNQSIEDEQYVLPTTQDLYTALVGSKIDLLHAYAQLSVDKESQEYLTINTQKSLFVSKITLWCQVIPKYFQAKMHQILQEIEKCACKHGILVWRNDWQENLTEGIGQAAQIQFTFEII